MAQTTPKRLFTKDEVGERIKQLWEWKWLQDAFSELRYIYEVEGTKTTDAFYRSQWPRRRRELRAAIAKAFAECFGLRPSERALNGVAALIGGDPVLEITCGFNWDHPEAFVMARCRRPSCIVVHNYPPNTPRLIDGRLFAVPLPDSWYYPGAAKAWAVFYGTLSEGDETHFELEAFRAAEEAAMEARRAAAAEAKADVTDDQ